jgi:hypothetical protein
MTIGFLVDFFDEGNEGSRWLLEQAHNPGVEVIVFCSRHGKFTPPPPITIMALIEAYDFRHPTFALSPQMALELAAMPGPIARYHVVRRTDWGTWAARPWRETRSIYASDWVPVIAHSDAVRLTIEQNWNTTVRAVSNEISGMARVAFEDLKR